jgi:hypothetical protein
MRTTALVSMAPKKSMPVNLRCNARWTACTTKSMDEDDGK